MTRSLEEPRWRVGERVRLQPHLDRTHMGIGVILDIEAKSAGFAATALVRFDSGPRLGMWYSIGSLKQCELPAPERGVAELPVPAALEPEDEPTRHLPPRAPFGELWFGFLDVARIVGGSHHALAARRVCALLQARGGSRWAIGTWAQAVVKRHEGSVKKTFRSIGENLEAHPDWQWPEEGKLPTWLSPDALLTDQGTDPEGSGETRQAPLIPLRESAGDVVWIRHGFLRRSEVLALIPRWAAVEASLTLARRMQVHGCPVLDLAAYLIALTNLYRTQDQTEIVGQVESFLHEVPSWRWPQALYPLHVVSSDNHEQGKAPRQLPIGSPGLTFLIESTCRELQRRGASASEAAAWLDEVSESPTPNSVLLSRFWVAARNLRATSLRRWQKPFPLWLLRPARVIKEAALLRTAVS
ncbi:MAG: hypothetical protein JKY65_07090 [Planctomycetes bacterium]|nr:hypothetical protein [Planctomycetota bacterium]